ncbi:hypothetical protein GOODEAATRI_029550, partial [Goodea atripinnis]
MELAGTHNPSVCVSAGDLEEDECINAAVGIVLNQPTTPPGPQRKNNRTPSIIRLLSPVAFCWVVLVIITGLRIH